MKKTKNIKNIKNIWKIISFPFIYLGVQLVVSLVYIIAAMMPSLFRMIFENAIAGGGVISEDSIYDIILSNMNLMTPVIISVVITFLIIFIIQRKEWKAEKFWGFSGFNNIPPLLLCLLLGAALNILTVCILTFLQVNNQPSVLDDMVGKNFILDFMAIAVIVPVLEEIIFRGIAHKYLDRLISRHLAVFIQALMFGLIHMNITQGIYAFFLGVIIGYIYLWFDSIYFAIAIHLAYNGTNILLFYIFGESDVDLLYFLIISVIVFVFSMAGLTVSANKRKKNPVYYNNYNNNRWQF